MSTPPPVLPPIRSLGIDLPAPFFDTEHAALLDDTLILASSGIERNHSLAPQRLPTLSNSLERGSDMPPLEAAHDAAQSDHEEDEHNDDDDDDEEQDEDDNDIESVNEDGDYSNTGSEGDSSGDEMEDGEMEGDRWRAIKEDTTEPCQDEQVFIQSKEEHCATDHAYWAQQTFFDLDDPDLKPGASGRIEWSIESFNGTQEKPNRSYVMSSPTVRIGGYDWQLRLYPKGNGTEFLSIYLDCVTLRKSDFVHHVNFKHPPLPVQAGTPLLKHRVSVAAQFSVIMYNPAEPRVYEYKHDAHQFHKQAADFGWKYFSHKTRYDFHVRRHGQRQAILRNDRLSFTAHIRIVDDPTGCMWDTTTPLVDNPVLATSLRSFEVNSAKTTALVLLFHLAPFRKWLYTTKHSTSPVQLLQILLERFLSRKLKRKHVRSELIPNNGDVVAGLQGLRAVIARDKIPGLVAEFDAVLGCLDEDDVPICHNRIKTSRFGTVQQAVDASAHSKSTPAVLMVELERQRFNRTKRSWEKVSNEVYLDNSLSYNNTKYILYAFVTHSGQLGSGNYVPYVRPGGLDALWYAYDGRQVKCLTQKAAASCYSGIDNASRSSSQTSDSYGSATNKDDAGIAYLAMYLRKDTSASAFSLPAEEVWQLPEGLAKKLSRPVERNQRADSDKPLQSISKNIATLSSINPPRTTLHPIIDAQAAMDGDDIIMSDAEDSTPPERCLNDTLHGSWLSQKSSGNTADGTQTYNRCINYFAGDFYDGTLLEGKYHGKGHLITTSGDDYSGEFKSGRPSGKGTMIYGLTGNKYTGDWLNGQHHGKGKLVEKASGNVFDGGWREGKRHGSFVLRGNVTDDDKQYCQICYENEMNTAFHDCGHVLACKLCASAVQHCPVCRRPVLSRLELFGVKISMQ